MGENNSFNQILSKSFLWMFCGLLISAGLAWYTYTSGLYMEILFNGYFNILLIVELVVVLGFSFLLNKLSPTMAALFYFVYAVINGLTLSVIFAVYELSSITTVFIVASLIFAVLSFIGFKTKKDLSGWGTYITVFLVFGIILSLVNVFVLKNDMVSILIDWFILLLFMGVTIYDINKLKRLSNDNSLDNSKLHIYFALQLYLDFINIFLRILSLFGKRK